MAIKNENDFLIKYLNVPCLHITEDIVKEAEEYLLNNYKPYLVLKFMDHLPKAFKTKERYTRIKSFYQKKENYDSLTSSKVEIPERIAAYPIEEYFKDFFSTSTYREIERNNINTFGELCEALDGLSNRAYHSKISELLRTTILLKYMLLDIDPLIDLESTNLDSILIDTGLSTRSRTYFNYRYGDNINSFWEDVEKLGEDEYSFLRPKDNVRMGTCGFGKKSYTESHLKLTILRDYYIEKKEIKTEKSKKRKRILQDK